MQDAMSRTHVTTRDQLLSAICLHIDSRKGLRPLGVKLHRALSFSPMCRQILLSQLLFVVKIVCDTAILRTGSKSTTPASQLAP